MQRRSQSIAQENIDLKHTWFTPVLEEYTSKTPTNVPRVTPENNRNIIRPMQPVQQVQESPVSKGVSVSEVIKRPVSEVV